MSLALTSLHVPSPTSASREARYRPSSVLRPPQHHHQTSANTAGVATARGTSLLNLFEFHAVLRPDLFEHMVADVDGVEPEHQLPLVYISYTIEGGPHQQAEPSCARRCRNA